MISEHSSILGLVTLISTFLSEGWLQHGAKVCCSSGGSGKWDKPSDFCFGPYPHGFFSLFFSIVINLIKCNCPSVLTKIMQGIKF
jgi:hypothetical protein